ncbi:MAG: arginine repressor [Pseudomonadota bacterium]|jgi:transcriptional regulator of arginine metabolism
MQPDRQQSDRRNTILRHLRAGAVRRQSDLVGLLKKDGFEVTQSSVSRDMRELGVSKAQGRYLPPGEEVSQAQGNFTALERFVRDIRTAGPSITVIRTSVGAAGSVAVAIDKAAWPEAVGTISGDDTIFIATQDSRGQHRLLERLRSVFRI